MTSLLSSKTDIVDFSAKNAHFGRIWNSLDREGRIQAEIPLNPETDVERYRKFLKSLSSKGEASVSDFVALMSAEDSAVFPIVIELFPEINEMLDSAYFRSDNLLAEVSFYFMEAVRDAAMKFNRDDFLVAVTTYPIWAANIIASEPYFPLELLLEDSYYDRFHAEKPRFKRWRVCLIRNRRDELIQYLREQLKKNNSDIDSIPDGMLMNISGYGEIEAEYQKVRKHNG